MSGPNPQLWLEVFAYTMKMAQRSFPHDHDLACDVATDCFDRFVRLYGDTGMADFQKWVGRSIACLKKNTLREQARYWRAANDEEEAVFERLRPVEADQELLFDVARWREKIELLEGRERDAFRILADGGNVKDIMDELGLGPREALHVVNSGRQKLLRDAA